MIKYVAIENGRMPNSTAYRIDLEADGEQVLSDGISTVWAYLRENMKPGDTYQENFGRHSGPAESYEQMVTNWKIEDDYNSGVES